jgi:uridine kinase
LADVQSLMNGQPITRKGYDYANHRRADTEEIITPPDVLILEGIHCFHDERLLKLMYLKLYMNVDADICLLRRIERDINERGRSIDSISNQYRSTVRPMFEQYIRNYVNLADVIVARGGKNARIVEILAGYVSDELHKRKTISE